MTNSYYADFDKSINTTCAEINIEKLTYDIEIEYILQAKKNTNFIEAIHLILCNYQYIIDNADTTKN